MVQPEARTMKRGAHRLMRPGEARKRFAFVEITLRRSRGTLGRGIPGADSPLPSLAFLERRTPARSCAQTRQIAAPLSSAHLLLRCAYVWCCRARSMSQAMTAHKMAPPDAGFGSRLRALSHAAQAERDACEEEDRAGLL